MMDRNIMKYSISKSLATLCVVVQLAACGGEQEDGSGAVSQNLGSVTVNWTPPATRTNGDPLLLSEISGYRVYYGNQPGDYPNRVDVNDGTAQQVTVQGERGFYYFVVTTVDSAGRESAFSPEFATNI
jgi:hypothetical protein